MDNSLKNLLKLLLNKFKKKCDETYSSKEETTTVVNTAVNPLLNLIQDKRVVKNTNDRIVFSGGGPGDYTTIIIFIDGVQMCYMNYEEGIFSWDGTILTNGVDIDGIDVASALLDRYTKAEVNSLIAGLPKMSKKIVSTLPTADINPDIIYLVPNGVTGSSDTYTEYMYINSKWEILGDTRVDLSNYYSKTEIDTKLTATDIELNEIISGAWV